MTRLAEIINLVGERSPLQKKQLEKIDGVLSDADQAAAERTLAFFIDKMRYSVADVAEAYLWFVETLMDEQMYFVRTGKYRNSTFAAIEPCYKNAQLMRNYMVALATTFYMFPQHIAANSFYKNILPPPISHSKTNTSYTIFGNWPGSRSSVRHRYGKQRLRQLPGGGYCAVVC